ncbi:methyltransferase domain-containing protein [Pararhizobium sp. DWP3-4]|uniref:methyltransferase domain-containing protein n=1 Tax=Pararhizobium sp. DWP3-4 TaxID=2804565 RepID=UPI003CF6AF47
MKRVAGSGSAAYDNGANELLLTGTLRPHDPGDLNEILVVVEHGIASARGTFYVNVKRLVHINTTAYRTLAARILYACQSKPDLRVVIVTSSVVAWSARLFSHLVGLHENISLKVYDSAFYPGQTFVENESFIPILRTQTKMTWRHEQPILARHGLVPGLAVADICCGIGDFAVLLKKEFRPSRLVALDHSAASLAYARRVVAEIGVQGIEYTYGDASQMLLEDNSFDFVTCRHSLQIFDRPEVLLKELFRICKPGGRVYITNEKNSHCLGEPRSESIQWTYTEVAKLFAFFDMDVEMGPKGIRLLANAGFDQIQMETFMVTNHDGDPQDFADVISAWENVYAGEMAVKRGDDPEFIDRFRKGFQDHMFAALHRSGYAGWPIWAASGRKPL